VVASHLDVTAPYSVVDLLKDVRRVDTLLAERALVEISDGFKILAGPSGFVGPASVSAHDIGYLIATLSQITDIVVIDLPCTYDDVYFELLATAGQIVLVGDQTLPSIRALKLVHEAVSMARKSNQLDQIVVNRYDAKNSAFTVDRLLNPIGVSSLLTIAADQAGASAAMHKGSPIRLAAPKSPILADIATLTRTLVAPSASPKPSAPGIFSRVRRAFSNT
jgi:Flp pilus assembly CpaE family ATPase